MDINFHPSSSEATNGTSSVFQQSDLVLVGLFINVSSVSGMLPSITITLQQSPDNTNWYNVGSIAVTISTTGTASSTPAALAMLADFIRIIWTISGTGSPSFTFSADVVAHRTV